jgi:hypothetical protein
MNTLKKIINSRHYDSFLLRLKQKCTLDSYVTWLKRKGESDQEIRRLKAVTQNVTRIWDLDCVPSLPTIVRQDLQTNKDNKALWLYADHYVVSQVDNDGDLSVYDTDGSQFTNERTSLCADQTYWKDKKLPRGITCQYGKYVTVNAQNPLHKRTWDSSMRDLTSEYAPYFSCDYSLPERREYYRRLGYSHNNAHISAMEDVKETAVLLRDCTEETIKYHCCNRLEETGITVYDKVGNTVIDTIWFVIDTADYEHEIRSAIVSLF